MKVLPFSDNLHAKQVVTTGIWQKSEFKVKNISVIRLFNHQCQFVSTEQDEAERAIVTARTPLSCGLREGGRAAWACAPEWEGPAGAGSAPWLAGEAVADNWRTTCAPLPPGTQPLLGYTSMGRTCN